MSKNEAKKIVRSYARALQEEHVPFRRMYLFGSQASGQTNRWSDIDVLVVADRFIGGHFLYKRKLWKATRRVDRRIEPHACTVKDFTHGDTLVAYEAKKHGERIV